MTQRAVFALTAQGAKLARTLSPGLPADVFLPQNLAGPEEVSFAQLKDAVNQAWTAYTQLIFEFPGGSRRLLYPTIPIPA